MSNVSNIEDRLRRIRPDLHGGSGAGRGGPPYNGDMEARVEKLEAAIPDIRDRLIKIEARLDMTATREDLHREMTAQTWRLVTFVTSIGAALVAATYFIARTVH
jgi:hypothetical protein